MANVRLEGITRKFEDVTAIEGITFEVPDGQFWVLVGPSGCGKSTILRMIAGLESATDGNLYIGDALVNGVPARQRDVAMVFQNYALYPHMTVADNLSFGLRMRKADSTTIKERVETVARSLDISHLLDRKPKQLSGGQQQRVALGRAIAREPKVFLLDEPLSNLDAQLRDGTRAELKQLHQRVGITTIYVTHDQVEAMTLADQIVVLNRGRIQQIGEPQDIYAKPANRMVATFLGNPPMNVFPATYTGDVFQVSGQVLPCPIALQTQLQLTPAQTIDLGIRPEHLEIIGLIDRESTEDTKNNQLELEVSVVEPLGRETLVRSNLIASDIVLNVQSPANWRGHPGDRISVQLDLDKLFVFDPNTGNVLYP
ncbi:ABC transporter ATP-binding protein [Microcoleus sp. FACHB-SPT15]|uniref:ABC transporter ATP-binding protein n=1 Tax=Microcoleus sp. FACHB-SPT15 TaxID=2692830 RepID=UPI00178615F4|nr:ABC transporter ATP-binding protein [Microcoleus sp. FACHB-SPT15]MBD1806258.1 ABC transporter ATP-binding protein [Microcoleus sp. FACHB-SPT15]